MLISIGICIRSGILNRRCTISRVLTRGGLGCVSVFRDVASAGAMYGAGERGAGVDTAQTAGENDDGKTGWYPYIRRVVGVDSSVVPVLCCIRATNSFAVARTGSGVGELDRPLQGQHHLLGLLQGLWVLEIRALWVDECRLVNLVGWRMRTRSRRGGRGRGRRDAGVRCGESTGDFGIGCSRIGVSLEANHPMFRSGALTGLTVPLTVSTGEGILVRDGVTVVGCEAGASLI